MRLTSPYCSQPIIVYRDTYGIPHISAATTSDAFFGQGLVHAWDRPTQMLRDRATAYGLIEDPATASKASDRPGFSWGRLGLAHVVRQEFQQLLPETRRYLESYAAGVNLGLRNVGHSLPSGRNDAAWEPWDSIAVFKLRHFDMGAFSRKLARSWLLANGYASFVEALYRVEDSTPIIDDYDTYSVRFDRSLVADVLEHLPETLPCQLETNLSNLPDASNSWAATGDRSRTGLPIIAGDSHRPMEVPNVYYQVHLSCPAFNAIGFSFPGVLGLPHFGHNEHVAWCITYGCGDNQDIFLERFNPKTNTYYYDGEWLPIQPLNPNAESTQHSPHPSRRTLRGWTQNGPIIWNDQDFQYGLSLRWAALMADSTFNSITSMLTAHDCNQLDSTMRSWVEPTNNLIAGDQDGGFFFRLRGRVPIRAVANRWIAVPGWKPEYQWDGYVPFDEMPADFTRSVLVTANNPVFGDDYDHYLSVDYRSDLRSRRIVELLGSNSLLDQELCLTILADTTSIAARQWAETMRELYERFSQEDSIFNHIEKKWPLRMAFSLILDWDGDLLANKTSPTLYTEAVRRLVAERWYTVTQGSLSIHENDGCGRFNSLLSGQLRAQILHRLVRGRPMLDEEVDVLIRSLNTAYQMLQARYGQDIGRWRWGRVHRLSLTTRENSIPMPGDNDTVRVASVNVNESTNNVIECPVCRYIFDTSDWDASKWIIPGGISENPESPHYMDQLPLWQNDQLVPALFSSEVVAERCSKAITVAPG